MWSRPTWSETKGLGPTRNTYTNSRPTLNRDNDGLRLRAPLLRHPTLGDVEYPLTDEEQEDIEQWIEGMDDSPDAEHYRPYGGD